MRRRLQTNRITSERRCRRLSGLLWSAVVLAFCLFTASRPVWGQVDETPGGCSADETLTRLEESYREQGPITFSYHKQTTSSVFGEQEPLAGQVWLDPAGQFRVEAGAEIFVGRGDTLWHYVPVYNQVTIRVLDSTARAGLPTDFLWSLRRDYLPVDCATDSLANELVLRVRTVARTKTAAIQRLTVWIEPQCFHVLQADYVDYNDDRVRLSFGDVKKDQGKNAEPYSLDLADSVEVIFMPPGK